MTTAEEKKLKTTCRFCDTHDPSKVGTKVCDCDNHCGYAHLACFYQYVRKTSLGKCRYCRKEWFIDKSEWKHFVRDHKHVTVVNRIREAATILLSIMVVLAMIIIWAFIVKLAVWIIYETPSYVPFHVLYLASSGWTRISVGDLVVGTMATTLNILLAVIWVHYKTRCYRCCCLTNKNIRHSYDRMGSKVTRTITEDTELEAMHSPSSASMALDRSGSSSLRVSRSVKRNIASVIVSDSDSDEGLQEV